MTSPLAAPLQLPCGAVLPNRIAKSAMTEALGDFDDDATPALERLYRRWSAGGAGLLISGHVFVDRRFLEQTGNVVLDDHSDEVALRAWAAAGTHGGNHLWAQLNHPGRQVTRFQSQQPVAPSAVRVPLRSFFARPRALSEREIRDLIAAFARAAAIARHSGFTGVQVHAAHGYLISQFLSPRTNVRDDDWGGALANRARFLLEVVRAVRRAVGPEYPLAVKLNASDFQRGGFAHADAVEVARMLAAEGIDLLELSGGTYERVAFHGESGHRAAAIGREAYFLEHARSIREAVPALPLMVSGGWRSPALMAAALSRGELDVLGIARPFCLQPEFPVRLLAGDSEPLPAPERRLRLGPGPLGPNSPSRNLRAFNSQVSIGWFYWQIERLGAGREPETAPGIGAHVLLRYVVREAWRSWRRRRWRRSRQRASGSKRAVKCRSAGGSSTMR